MEYSEYPKYNSVLSTGSDISGITGSGILHSVSITLSGAVSASNSVVVYDNTAGSDTILFECARVSGVNASDQNKQCAILDVSYQNGLYVDITGSNRVIITYLPKY